MKYRFIQDDDCHWYLIPADKHREFIEWAYGDGGDGFTPMVALPQWATICPGSPSDYNFADPILDWRDE